MLSLRTEVEDNAELGLESEAADMSHPLKAEAAARFLLREAKSC